jgi:hypothetical protein
MIRPGNFIKLKDKDYFNEVIAIMYPESDQPSICINTDKTDKEKSYFDPIDFDSFSKDFIVHPEIIKFTDSYCKWVSINQIEEIKIKIIKTTCWRCNKSIFITEPNEQDGTSICYLCKEE